MPERVYWLYAARLFHPALRSTVHGCGICTGGTSYATGPSMALEAKKNRALHRAHGSNDCGGAPLSAFGCFTSASSYCFAYLVSDGGVRPPAPGSSTHCLGTERAWRAPSHHRALCSRPQSELGVGLQRSRH